MLNESQHSLLLNPKVQALISALDCIPADTQAKTRHQISTRVQSWIISLQNSQHNPRVSLKPNPFTPNSDIQEFIQVNLKNNPQWSPF